MDPKCSSGELFLDWQTVSAQTVRNESTYIISFLTREKTNRQMTDEKAVSTHRPLISRARITFCWWRHNRLLMISKYSKLHIIWRVHVRHQCYSLLCPRPVVLKSVFEHSFCHKLKKVIATGLIICKQSWLIDLFICLRPFNNAYFRAHHLQKN